MNTGIELITKEREEQMRKRGYTTRYDVTNNTQNELISAIMLIAGNIGFLRQHLPMPLEAFEDLRPETWDKETCYKILTKSEIEQLQILGAFAAAEIDRLQNS